MDNKYSEMSDEELEELLEKGRTWLAKNHNHVQFNSQLDKFCEAWSIMDDRKKKEKRLF